MTGRKRARGPVAPVRRSRRGTAPEEEPRDGGEEAEVTAETRGEEAQDKEETRGEAAEVTGETRAGEKGPLQAESQGPQEPPSVKRKRGAPAMPAPEIPRGKPKSGRVWKENKTRFSSMVQDRALRSSWEVKMKQRNDKKMMKSFAQHLKDEKQQEKEEKKRRREDNLKRKLENERKAEVVQVIRNPTKLKRARKKLLRTIEKRDTLMMSQAGKKLQQKKKMAPSKGTEEKASTSR